MKSLVSHTWRGPLARIIFSLLGAGLISLTSACQKPNDEPFTSESEIQRFMENNLDALEIFEAVVYPSDTLLIDSSAGLLRRLVITEHSRTPPRISIRARAVEIENYGSIFIATATVNDRFTGDYLQLEAGQPNRSDIWDGALAREALFFKLQSDAAPYLGWEFVGYDTGKPLALIGANVTIRVFPVGGAPSRIISDKQPENLENVPENFTLMIHLDPLRSGERVEIETRGEKYTVFARTAAGFRRLETEALGGGRFKYSFIVPRADPAGRFFHLLTFQAGPEIFIDSLFNVFADTAIDTQFIPPDTIVETLITFDSTLSETVQILDPGEIWTFPYSVR